MSAPLKPLFRPETLHEKLRNYQLPPELASARQKLAAQARNLRSAAARKKESTLFPAFFADVFGDLLGYIQPSQAGHHAGSAIPFYTLHPNFTTPKGELADAAIGNSPTQGSPSTVIAIVEMKGPGDPLDIPHGGRRLSAVEQAFGYAIDVPCDWIIVSSMVETRLYCKRADRLSCERFLIDRLANPEDDSQLRKFVYLLGANRVVRPSPLPSHLDELFEASRITGRRVTNEFYIQYAAMREEAYHQLAHANPAVEPAHVLAATQKLLDRILFCAFSEDRGLLPADTIARAFAHTDPYSLEPRSRWDNFRALFRSVDQGNPALGISRYNGGLFAHDPLLDGQLQVPEAVCETFRELGAYEYRAFDPADPDFPDNPAPPAFLDVEILGHIFEQSITDLERLRERLKILHQQEDVPIPAAQQTQLLPDTVPATDAAAPPAKTKAKARRKKEGAFYTPAYITRFLVQRALGSVLSDRFEELRSRLQREAKGTTAATSLRDPRAYELDKLNDPQRTALRQFWSDWRYELGKIRILDPACGSGAFLIEAFDQLLAEYQAANSHYNVLSDHPEFLDLNRIILQQNLFGVDLNAEAVEICRLSLWIKTAEKGKILADLDQTIRVGNSLVDDPNYAPGKAFDWNAAFPEVFADGGFDVVVGNPPYVRQEWIAPIKPYLQSRYRVYSGTADLYLYFVEKGLQVLKPGGRLGFITSGTFARGGFASEFRQWLPTLARFEALVNFGENQPFEDAEMVYPTMYVLQKETRPSSFPALFIHEQVPPAVDELMERESIPCENASVFAAQEWKFQPAAVSSLFSRLMSSGTPLRQQAANRMYRGVLTGLNEAFIIDQATRDRLVHEDPHSEALLKKVLGGQDLRPWYQSWEQRWLMLVPSGHTRQFAKTSDETIAWQVFSKKYRALANHLSLFEAAARKRSDQGEFWWELRSCDYYQEFAQTKIVWPDIAKLPRFSWDTEQFYLGNTGYILVPPGAYFLAILQSRATWFCISQLAMPLRLRGGLWQYRCIDAPVAQLPIPKVNKADQEQLGELALNCTSLARERSGIHNSVRHRIHSDLAPADKPLNTALSEWWNLDFRTLRAELKKACKTDIPLGDRDAWEAQLTSWKLEHDALTRRLVDSESEINDRVYHLFGLTSQEICTLEDFQKQTRTFHPLGAW